jgi:hypothetical protein
MGFPMFSLRSARRSSGGAEGSLPPLCQGGAKGWGRNGKIGRRVSRGRPPPSLKPSGHPTSAMRVKAPPRGFVPSAPCWNPNVFSLSSPKPNPNRRFEPPPFSDLPTATCATNAIPDSLSGRLAARSRAAVAASNRPISILFQRLGWPDSSADSIFCLPLRARCTAQPLVGILIFFPKFQTCLPAFAWGFDRPAGHLGQVFRLAL